MNTSKSVNVKFSKMYTGKGTYLKDVCVHTRVPTFTGSNNSKIKERKEKELMSTALGIPRRSPIQVLTEPDVA